MTDYTQHPPYESTLSVCVRLLCIPFLLVLAVVGWTILEVVEGVCKK